MEIQVLDLRLQNNGKPLRAFVDIGFHGLEIRDFRVIQQPDHRAYVTSPELSWRGPGGRVQYKTLIGMSDALKWKIEAIILAEFQKTEAEHGRNNIG